MLYKKINSKTDFKYGPAYYVSHKLSNSKSLNNNIIVYLPLFRRAVNNRIHYILYDNEGCIIESFYNYINSYLLSFSENSRKYIVTALRRFHEFLTIYSLCINEINAESIGLLKQFLIGKPFRDTSDYASFETVNRYLGIIRDYLVYTGNTNNELLKNRSYYMKGYDIRKNYYNYPSSNNTIQEIPAYISMEEARNLVKAIFSPTRKLYTCSFLNTQKEIIEKNNKLHIALGKEINNTVDNPTYDETAFLLFQLMYGYGLRVGEALGLTDEDIVSEVTSNEIPRYYIYLRNRVSDNAYQYCKNLLHVSDKNEYKTKTYMGSLGTTKIQINEALYKSLRTYISRTIPVFKKMNINHYNKCLIADSVSSKNNSNFYVFTGLHGARLSADCWNDILRSYFLTAGIPIDIKVRDKNLSHRLRHGYAMTIVSIIDKINRENPNNPPLGLADLQRALRHRSINSCLVYYSKDINYEITINQKFCDEFYNKYPELQSVFSEENKIDSIKTNY